MECIPGDGDVAPSDVKSLVTLRHCYYLVFPSPLRIKKGEKMRKGIDSLLLVGKEDLFLSILGQMGYRASEIHRI